MAIVKFFDGAGFIEVEVSDEFAAEYVSILHRESLVERKETRRHQSLDKSLEHGFDVADKRTDIESDTILKEDFEVLHNAIAKLQPQQQELIRRVYFNDEKMTDIAKEENVDDSSIRHRMQRALKMLKKYLE